jgi:hypothetical protein
MERGIASDISKDHDLERIIYVNLRTTKVPPVE